MDVFTEPHWDRASRLVEGPKEAKAKPKSPKEKQKPDKAEKVPKVVEKPKAKAKSKGLVQALQKGR